MPLDFVFSPDILYSYGEVAVATMDVKYAYDASVLETTSVDVVYRYGTSEDRWPRQKQFWAYSTQELANLFPRWHDIRHNIGGMSQSLINAWGISFDWAKQEYARFRRQLFLESAEYEEPDKFAHAAIGDFLLNPRAPQNIIRNSDFGIRGLARRNTPIWWSTMKAETTGTAELVQSPVMVGSHSMKLHCDVGENAYVRQQRVLAVEGQRWMTGSIWYMAPVPTGVLTADGRAKLELHIMYFDGTMDYAYVPLQLATNGEWVRAQVNLYMAKDVFAFTYTVRLENDGSEPCRIYLDAAQLEQSPRATKWEPAPVFVPYVSDEAIVIKYFDAFIDEGAADATEEIVPGSPLTYSAKRGRSLMQVATSEMLWWDLAPTRATTTAVTGDTPDGRTREQFGWYTNVEREFYSTGFRIANNKIEHYNMVVTGEVYAIFDIGEFWLDEDHLLEIGIDDTVTRTLEALCVFKERIWVLCTETTGGVTKRVLKILNPMSRWPIPEAYDQNLPDLHLECIGDVDIGLSTGTADYLGWVESNPDQFLIRVDGSYYTIDLEYDYYYLDVERRQAILRHPYEGELVTV